MSNRKRKTIRATMFDPAFEVELESTGDLIETYIVYKDDVKIGYITSHSTASERAIRGARYVHRGNPFKAWAQSLDDGRKDRYDYYAQHRSQSEAIRRLVSASRRA